MSARFDIMRLPALGLIVLLVAGCASSPPTNLYTLSAIGVPSTESGLRQSASAVVAIGPVTLPDYIDRPQIVTRQSPYRLELAAYDQWAAPLHDMLPRVLIDDVALRLPSHRVLAFPLVSEGNFDYRVAVDIGRFDVDATGEATLAARWQLYARSTPRALQVAEDVLQRRSEGDGYGAYAASLSGVIADLSGHIAEAVKSARASAARPLADQPPAGIRRLSHFRSAGSHVLSGS